MLYSIKTFGGMLPRVEPRLLQPENAQIASGTKLRSGALVPFRESAIVQSIEEETIAGYQTLYQYNHTSEDIFMYFEDDVDIVKGPIANDQYNRTYITGLDKPRGFDSSMVSTSDTTIDSTNSYELSIPLGAAASLAVSGSGSGTAVSRAYVYTYLREWSDGKLDEGQPSLPATDSSGNDYIDVLPGETVTMSGIEDAADAADNGVSEIAIYRVATGTDSASFQLVIQFNIADAKSGSVSGVTWNSGTSTFSYDDDLLDTELGSGLTSTTWASPSDDLTGLISLRNGCLVAFEDNVVHFSEPYQPHAWPVEYQVTLDENIVGLGAFGNTVVAMTERFPIMLSAADPTIIITQPTHITAPCLSKRGIVKYENSVYYPSVDGLMMVNSDGVSNVSQSAFTHDSWLDYNPASFEAEIQDGRYIALYSTLEGGGSGLLILDLEEALAAAATDTISATAFFVDKRSDVLYYVGLSTSGLWQIKEWEGQSTYRIIKWKSKIFTSTMGPANLVACRIRAVYADLDQVQNSLIALAAASLDSLHGEINGAAYNTMPWNGDLFSSYWRSYESLPKIYVTVYADNEVILQKQLLDTKPFKLPAGITGHYFEIQVETNVPIYQIDMATSMRELL